jgi:hypothetical protein
MAWYKKAEARYLKAALPFIILSVCALHTHIALAYTAAGFHIQILERLNKAGSHLYYIAGRLDENTKVQPQM